MEEQAAESQDLFLLQITPDFLEAPAWVLAELVGWLGAVRETEETGPTLARPEEGRGG